MTILQDNFGNLQPLLFSAYDAPWTKIFKDQTDEILPFAVFSTVVNKDDPFVLVVLVESESK